MGERCIQDFGGETSGKETTWKHRAWMEDNIKMDHKKVKWGMYWIAVAEDMDRQRAVVNEAMNLRVLYNAGNFLTNRGPISFS
jgi:hypothetical protein